MAAHSHTLAWKIPWTEEPGRMQSMRLRRVGHDWATSLSLFTFMHWRRKWQPTPVFLPGESQGRRSLVGCHLWGCTESDTTEATWQQQQHITVKPDRTTCNKCKLGSTMIGSGPSASFQEAKILFCSNRERRGGGGSIMIIGDWQFNVLQSCTTLVPLYLLLCSL